MTTNAVDTTALPTQISKEAPYYTDPIDQNTDPFTYDLLGRRFFVKASYKF